MNQLELFSPVPIGQTVEIFAGRSIGGEPMWEKYKVLDWEQPRMDTRGRVLFTAQAIGHSGNNISPMIVESNRIRIAEVKRRIEASHG